MFNDIGKKIMNAAKIFFWICVIGFSILGISMIAMSQNAYDRTAESQMLTSGITIICVGLVVSWFGAICLYGFGKLIDDNAQNRILLERIAGTNSQQSSNSTTLQHVQSASLKVPQPNIKQNSTVASTAKTNPYVDSNLCVGCEMCVSTCPELFRMENNKAIVVSDITAETWVKGHEAIDNCPMQAIIEK